MDLVLLRSLLAVVEYGGLTEAAAHLGVSQSALSRRMAQLQEELQAPLLQRVGRSVVLTELGRLALEDARSLVQRYDALKRRLHEHVQLQAGVVRIGGGATAVAFLLPKEIAAFRERHPGIVFQLKEAGSRDTEEAVLRSDLELGAVTLPTRSKEVIVRPWVEDRIVLVAASKHRLARQRTVRATDLEGETVVGFEADTAVRRLIDAALRQVGVRVNVAMELRSVAAILQMVEATQSLAFVSEVAVPARRAITVDGLNVVRRLALVSRTDRSLSPASKRFCEQLGLSE